MTQICPGFGEAPVPTLLSVICKPEGVVMVFPTAWAAAVVGAPAAKTPANTLTKANTARGRARGKARIISPHQDRRVQVIAGLVPAISMSRHPGLAIEMAGASLSKSGHDK
jgi:hypothetical protein